MPFPLAALLVFLIAVLLSGGSTPVAARLGYRLEMLDRPGGRRRHRGEIPRTGGLALWLAFVLAVLFAQILPIPRFDPKEVIRLTGLLLGGTLSLILGLIDDRWELPPGPQFLGQAGGCRSRARTIIRSRRPRHRENSQRKGTSRGSKTRSSSTSRKGVLASRIRSRTSDVPTHSSVVRSLSRGSPSRIQRKRRWPLCTFHCMPRKNHPTTRMAPVIRIGTPRSIPCPPGGFAFIII